MDTTATAVKKEPSNSSDEMKEFAETAMNELLGWYGYEPEDDDTDARRGTGDSSGPEYSDSGGGGGGGSGGSWCGWCSKPMPTGTQATGAFCSELCFSQSRRASFKRNRTCDWCRTARNSVSHVDVRDGARRLQFCGDACLNQYKMHIFCRETRAHLQLHPHAPVAPTSGTGLITPELWLKNCRQTESPPLPPAPSPPAPRRRPRRAPRPQPASTVLPEPAIPVTEGPEDLRTRPRSPLDRPPDPEEQFRFCWPPPPPPVTVLVPYPIVVPVPLPLPLPIPIPVPEEVFRRAASTASEVTKTTSTTTNAPTIVTASEVKPPRRTLRARKRPAPSPRTTVPA